MEYLIDVQSLKEELTDVIHFLHSHGWAPATSCNFSFRIPNTEYYWISKTGIDKGNFADNQLILIDKKALPLLDPQARPGVETPLHVALYDNRQTNCVLHTHSVNDTVLSLHFKEQGYIIIKDIELLKAIEGNHSPEKEMRIPIFHNLQDTKQLCSEISAYYKEHPEMKAFLIAGHGMYTWAETIFIAKRQIEALQFMLECQYRTLTIAAKH